MSAFETDSRLRKKEKMYEKEVIFHINRIAGCSCDYCNPCQSVAVCSVKGQKHRPNNSVPEQSQTGWTCLEQLF